MQISAIRVSPLILVVSLFALVTVIPAGAAGLEFQRQTISVPAVPAAWQSCLADIDNDGLVDLLAVGPVEKRLWIYRQRASGFPATPDQVLELPAQTAWLALCHVDKDPGLELLLSSPTGLTYLRQNHGVFETQPRALVQASQVFTNGDSPRLLRLETASSRTNLLLPVISASELVLYQRNSAGDWTPGAPLPLRPKQTRWSSEQDAWAMGSTRARRLEIHQSFQTSPLEEEPEKKAEAELVKKLLQDLDKENPERHWQGVDRVDINGDGQEDLVLWWLTGELQPKTDIHIFLRGADHRLPAQPTQVLHCRGFPVQVGQKSKTGPAGQRISPVCDLKGDGHYELVLATLKANIMSASGVADLLLSGSLQWDLTIRTFEHGVFAHIPDGSVTVATMVPSEQGAPELILINGDFNGDGRPDVLVKRSPTQWDVVFSSADGWFEAKPALSFEVPIEGHFDIQDLNGDGRSDLVVRASEEPKLFVFLSQARRQIRDLKSEVPKKSETPSHVPD